MMRYVRAFAAPGRRFAAGPEAAGESQGAGEHADEHARALRRYLFFFMIPLWFVPGVADWYWHRKTKIERTSGTHESLTHALMMGIVGVPVTAAMLCEINALIIASLMVAYVLHEGVTYWDVRYAKGLRDVPTIEQHTHSFLEMLPFIAASAAICMRPKQFEALFGRGGEPAEWKLEPKRPALGPGYVAAILGCVGAFIVVPYAEEFVRCYRVDRTLLPHPAQTEDGCEQRRPQ